MRLLVFISIILFLSCSETTENSIVSLTISEITEEKLRDSIYHLEEKLVNKESLSTDKQTAVDLIEAVNKYAERFPKSKDREGILYKAVLAGRGLNKPYLAIQILTKLIKEYPSSNYKVDYLYEKGSIFEDLLGADEEAKEIYEVIVRDYPNHEWGRDSKARLDNMATGLSDLELIKKFERENGQ